MHLHLRIFNIIKNKTRPGDLRSVYRLCSSFSGVQQTPYKTENATPKSLQSEPHKTARFHASSKNDRSSEDSHHPIQIKKHFRYANQTAHTSDVEEPDRKLQSL